MYYLVDQSNNMLFTSKDNIYNTMNENINCYIKEYYGNFKFHSNPSEKTYVYVRGRTHEMHIITQCNVGSIFILDNKKNVLLSLLDFQMLEMKD